MFIPIPIPLGLFRRRGAQGANTPRDTRAAHEAMCRFNPHALVGNEGSHAVMIEDVSDPDGRMYRMEYQSTPDGRHAVAFCRHNPWGQTPNAGVALGSGHVDSDGLICMGNRHAYSRDPARSGHDLTNVIQRSRFWCTAFSVFKETGSFPQP